MANLRSYRHANAKAARWISQADRNEQLDFWRRSDVLKLLRCRGTLRPINESDLKLLLELGLPGLDAHRLAPWIGLDEMEILINRADDNWQFWKSSVSTHTRADKVGDRLELTFEEYRDFGPFRLIYPCDVPRAYVREYLAVRKREKDREYRRKKRLREQTICQPLVGTDSKELVKLSVRAQAILNKIDDVWRSSVGLGKSLSGADPFRRSKRRSLSPSGLRQAVWRSLRELLVAGLIEEKMRVGERGLQVRFVRRFRSKR